MGTTLLLLLTTGLSLGAERPLTTPAHAKEVTVLGGDHNAQFQSRMDLRLRSLCYAFYLTMDEFIIPDGFYSRTGHFVSIHFLLGKDHAVLYYKGMSGYKYETAELIGRTLDENPDMLRTFEEYVEWKGWNKSEIINPPDTEPCEYHSKV